MDDEQLRKLLQRLGLSWRGYRKVRKGVKKRIRRHISHLGCPNLDAYLLELEKSEALRLQCERLLTVSISRFFRDRRLWEILEADILPEHIKKNPDKIKVWSAGCASGEEVYSLRILWDRFAGSGFGAPALEITATDLNPSYLERAAAGIYPPSSLREVHDQLRSLYFRKVGEGMFYAVKASIKGGITWKVHHLLTDPPESQFHLIFLRNSLLTYYDIEIRRSALGKVITCLSSGGFLFIGSHEKLPYDMPDLLPHASLSYVFKKTG